MSEKLKQCSNPDCFVHCGETCAKGEVHPETHCVHYLRAELAREKEKSRSCCCIWCGENVASYQGVATELPETELQRILDACRKHDSECLKNPLRAERDSALSRAERAELERDTATRTVENIEGKVAMYDGKRRVAEAALGRVEAERGVLARELSCSAICWRYSDKQYCPDPLLRRDCKKCWIFRAGQEVQESAKREGVAG